MAKDLNLSVTLRAINKATGPLKKILQGSRGVGRAMRESREELKDFNDQQRRIQAFRDMSRQSQETRNALREKRQALERVTRELKTATGPTRRLTQQQEKAQREVDKLNGQYRDQRERVRELSRNLPRAADGTRGLTQQQDALERQIRETNDRLNRQRDALGRLSDANVAGRFRNMAGEIGRLGRNTLIAGGAAAGGIFALANSTATLGDDVAKSAGRMGISISALQELRYAAERSGVSTQKLDSSTERFVKRLGEARQGGGAAAKAYEQLGLDANQLAELTPSDALGVVADRLAQVENHTDKVALAAQFFGREGVAMVNMLKDGSSGLDQLRQDARATGYVLSDEAARDAETFKDALLDAELGMSGMKNTIGAELMPAITELMRDLSGWMRENRDRVKAFARTFGDRLKAAVPTILELGRGVATFAAKLGELTTKAADAVGGFDNLAVIAATLFAGKAIASVLSFGLGVGKAIGAMAAFANTLPVVATGVKALSAAFAATPIGWIVAGIAAVAAGAYWIYNNWDWLGPWFADLWDTMKAKASAFWKWLKGVPSEVGDAISSYFTNWTLAGQLIQHWDSIKTSAGELWEWFKSAPGNAIDAVAEMISNWDLKGILEEKWTAAIDYLKNLPGRMRDAGMDVARGLGQGIKNGASNAWNAVRDAVGGTEDEARDRLDTHSPSRVFKAIGGDVMAGLQQGIQRNERGPLREVDDFAKRLRRAGGGLVLGAAAMAGSGTATAEGAPLGMPSLDARPPLQAADAGGLTIQGGINIEVNAAPGMDEQALAGYVRAEVQRALAEASRDAAARQRSAFHDID